MSTTRRFDIVGSACLFPSGPSINLADAAVKTSLCLVRQHPYYVDRCGFNVKVSYFPAHDRSFVAQRWCELAGSVMDQLLPALHGNQRGHGEVRIKSVYLVMPPRNRPGPPDGVDAWLTAVIRAKCRCEQVTVVEGGHAAGLVALQAASSSLLQDGDAISIVIAIDSALNHHALKRLEDCDLLHGAHRSYRGSAIANAYGRVPSEGAAAVAIRRSGQRDQHSSWATLTGLASANEPITFDNPRPCIGAGLTEAALGAIAQASAVNSDPVSELYVDLNSEPYRADQFGFTTLRLTDSLGSNWSRVDPGLASGDLGAASGLTHVALVAYKLHQLSLAGATSGTGSRLILSSSDDSLRSAAVVSPAKLLNEVRRYS